MNNPHAWSLADLKSIPSNGIKVMSTFACGGGSSMGYKLAGCEVVAANDIDPEMAWHYKLNINPKYYFLCPIRDLLTKDLPVELHTLDILDGSPPCSTFSMAGSREEAWGKKKHFRE
jgi:DNA (cytosine-5)-methyltransferase 1